MKGHTLVGTSGQQEMKTAADIYLKFKHKNYLWRYAGLCNGLQSVRWIQYDKYKTSLIWYKHTRHNGMGIIKNCLLWSNVKWQQCSKLLHTLPLVGRKLMTSFKAAACCQKNRLQWHQLDSHTLQIHTTYVSLVLQHMRCCRWLDKLQLSCGQYV
jgi:hypothetical protein